MGLISKEDLLKKFDSGALLFQPDVRKIIEEEPEVHPEDYEWCTGCKEYDHERGCCPRFGKVIAETVEEVKQNLQIIRCEECKHLFDGEHNKNCCEVLMEKAKWLTEITVDMNWHCADGERRTDE